MLLPANLPARQHRACALVEKNVRKTNNLRNRIPPSTGNGSRLPGKGGWGKRGEGERKGHACSAAQDALVLWL
jgi:hypothetical protein